MVSEPVSFHPQESAMTSIFTFPPDRAAVTRVCAGTAFSLKGRTAFPVLTR